MRKYILLCCILANYLFARGQSAFNNTGSFFVAPGSNVNIFGDFNNDGTFTDSGTAVTFSGSANQSISGTSVTTFKNMVLNNSAGITLNQNAIIGNSIALTSGPLILNSKLLTINASGTTAISRTAGYIKSESTNNSSKIKWNIATQTGAHIFPFGTAAGSYIPFTFNLTAGTIGNVTVSTYPTATNNLPFPSTPVNVTHVNDSLGVDRSASVVDRFWQIDKDGASGTATMTFVATAAEVGTITNLKAQRWNAGSTSWDHPLPGQTNTAYSATVSGVTTFSPWTLSENGIMLPLEKLDFNAVLLNKQVNFGWNNEFENNADYYIVEKTTDRKNYQQVGKFKAKGNSGIMESYTGTDKTPDFGLSYYRVKLVGLSGQIAISPWVSIFVNTQTGINVFPNPVTNGSLEIHFSGYKDETFTTEIVALNGQTLYTDKDRYIKYDESVIHIANLVHFAPGIYIIRVIGNSSITCKNIIIQ